MALVNHAKKEINAKIVYYGPPGTGKKATLTYIYSRVKSSLRGELKTVPAGSDNLMLFDFSPFDTPRLNGYRLRLHVYTITGVVTNPATWKMTLKGTDGIVIMLNPSVEHTVESRESLSQLRDFLSAYGVGLHETPAVLQFNTLINENELGNQAEIAAALDLSGLTICCANPLSGDGLLESISTVSRQILERISVKGEQSETAMTSSDATTENEPLNMLRQDELESPTKRSDVEETIQASLLSEEIFSKGGTIRIPLEIKQGEKLHRLVVTVNVELE